MSIYTEAEDGNFTIVRNEVIRESGISLKSLGLFTVLRSHAADFRVTAEDLAKTCRVNKDTIFGYLKELRALGLVVNARIQANGEWSSLRIVRRLPAKTDADIAETLSKFKLEGVRLIDLGAVYWHIDDGHALKKMVLVDGVWVFEPPKSDRRKLENPESGSRNLKKPASAWIRNPLKDQGKRLNPPPTSSQQTEGGRKDFENSPQQTKQPVAKLDQSAWLAERGVPEHIAGPWLKQLKLRPTAVGLKALEAEAQAAGRSLAEVVAIMLAHGWAKWTASSDQLAKPYPLPASPAEIQAAELAKAEAERSARRRQVEADKAAASTNKLLSSLTADQLDAMAATFCQRTSKPIKPFDQLAKFEQQLCKSWLRGQPDLLHAAATS